jgi:radical SAM superfamily enzyme YgiQ (UPF0313 family)
MACIGNLICLTPVESYVVDEPTPRKGLLGRFERWTGPFVRSPGIGFAYLVGFLRKNGFLGDAHVVVQHDRLEGQTPFERIMAEKLDLGRGDHDVLFITAFTNSAREAYRRARQARAAWAAAGRGLTIVFGGPHPSAVPHEGTRFGHVDAVVQGEGEWAAAELLEDVRQGRPVLPLYKAGFGKIRQSGTLALDMEIWRGLNPRPHQIVASTTLARGCKLDCHFCAVKLTNGPTVRNRDLTDVVEEIESQGPAFTRDTIDRAEAGFYSAVLRGLLRLPVIGGRYADRLIARMGPGYSRQFFFWDDNLYNAPGSMKALCEAIRPLGRPWAAQLTMDIADKPELLELAYASGCRDLFLGIESVSQSAIDGLDKWSNTTSKMTERVQRIHDSGINIMGAFVFGLNGDDASVFDRTLEFIYKTGIDFVVANILQPYPGTGTFTDAVAANDLLPWAGSPVDSDVAMEYNWPLFDGAHVLVRPQAMSVDQLQEGYYYFLREAYSLSGIARRFRGSPAQAGWATAHFARNYLLSRYGMTKTAHAIRRKGAGPVGGAAVTPEGYREGAFRSSPAPELTAAAVSRPAQIPQHVATPAASMEAASRLLRIQS